MHAALGFGGAVVLLDALLLTYHDVPFTCAYVPSENMKALGPIYVVVFTFVSVSFAKAEVAALDRSGLAAFVVVLAVAFAACRIATVRRRRPPIEFDQRPATLQRLELHT